MKKNKLTVVFFLTCYAVCVFLLSSCSAVSYNAPFTPKGKAEYERNPDCGFYMPVSFTFQNDGIDYDITPHLQRNNLLHLRLNLAPYRSLELSDNALNDFDDMLRLLRENSVCAIVRFAYDGFNGYADKEPAMELLLRHVKQLGGVLERYADVVTAVEAGMIGPWGEMHTSVLAKKENFNALLGAWLKSLNSETPVLARRPQMVADYLGINIDTINEHRAAVGSEAYRLGVFNDGYLGSESDLGTYRNREKEVEWLNYQAAHTPFGGEVTVPGSKYNKIEYAAKEMFLTHTSYLNELWNDTVVAEWKSTLYTEQAGSDKSYYGKTAYEYIRDHLGYRFYVKDVILPSSVKSELRVRFSVANEGFGNLLKRKKCEFILTGENETYTIAADLDPAKWFSKNTYAIDVTLNGKFLPGNYVLSLRLSDPLSKIPIYCVAFANGSFDESSFSNVLGNVSVQ